MVGGVPVHPNGVALCARAFLVLEHDLGSSGFQQRESLLSFWLRSQQTIGQVVHKLLAKQCVYNSSKAGTGRIFGIRTGTAPAKHIEKYGEPAKNEGTSKEEK